MALIVIEEELLAPPGFRFCASFEDADPPVVGVGDTRCDAVASLLAKVGMPILMDLVWWLQAHGENGAWLPQIKAEIEARK